MSDTPAAKRPAVRKRKRSPNENACPGMRRDGRCCPGAWLCRICKKWHYLKRRPVQRGTSRTLRGAIKAGFAF